MTARGGWAETAPVSDWCQRWRSGRHSFVHRRDGGFDAARYEVVALDGADQAQARRYVATHHYLRTFPAAVRSFGLRLGEGQRDGGDLVGVAVFSVPAHPGVITKVFPELDHTNACELGRLVLEGPPARQGGLGRAPANAESFFVARCLEELAAGGWRGVVSFADPVLRPGGGGGHVGIVYQALNMRYTGRGTARTLAVLPDGRVLSERSLQKVRTGERGADGVERTLVTLGATVRAAGQDRRRWLRDALDAVGAARMRHGGNHRFAVALGTSRRDRRAVRVALDALPYPKRADGPGPLR